MNACHFLRRFVRTRCSCWQYTSALNGLRTKKKLIPANTPLNYYFMNLCLCSKLQGLILVNPRLFPSNIVIFLHLRWHSWETGHALKEDFSQWICSLSYSFHEECEEPERPVCYIFLFFQMETVGWGVLRCAYSRVLLRRFNSINSLKRIRPPGLISQWRITRTKFWKTVLDFAVSNDTLAINHCSCFFSDCVIVKLPQHNMSKIHFHFVHFQSVRS